VAERNTPLTGLILAGGAGSRMGGADKGWLLWKNRPLIEYALERLSPQVDRVLISANRNLERYRNLGVEVLTDHRPDLPGPLAGIEAGLLAAQPGYLLVVPCDAPGFPLDLAARLLRANASAAFARTPERTQPLFALLHTDLLADLQNALDHGERRVHAWLGNIGALTVDFDDSAAFVNLNTPQSLNAGIHPSRRRE